MPQSVGAASPETRRSSRCGIASITPSSWVAVKQLKLSCQHSDIYQLIGCLDYGSLTQVLLIRIWRSFQGPVHLDNVEITLNMGKYYHNVCVLINPSEGNPNVIFELAHVNGPSPTKVQPS